MTFSQRSVKSATQMSTRNAIRSTGTALKSSTAGADGRAAFGADAASNRLTNLAAGGPLWAGGCVGAGPLAAASRR